MKLEPEDEAPSADLVAKRHFGLPQPLPFAGRTHPQFYELQTSPLTLDHLRMYEAALATVVEVGAGSWFLMGLNCCVF
jgi:hypothetical protein